MTKYISLLLILIVTNVFAKETQFISTVSYVGMSMDYKEYAGDGTLLDSEESSFQDLSGIEVGFAYKTYESNSSSSEITFNYMILGGITEYVGSLLGSNEVYGSYVGSTLNTVVDTDISY